MSIEVSSISKVFGQQRAVDQISFSVGEGEIVGFLGPNGAGKSTTMKMITGALPATEGSIRVGGLSVANEPMAIKRLTGYLPEHNPLYLDMYVHEYLLFMASLYNITGKAGRHRVEEMVALCGLTEEQNKRIGMLSKGYRQRVGLAQALIHDPAVLVLDEPTSGLDPNQLIEIRNLIRKVSEHKTVLFSSHILQEVEALCNRVIVIHKGKIVADDRLEHLLKRGGDQLVVEFDKAPPSMSLEQLPGVNSVVVLAPTKFQIKTDRGVDIRDHVVKLAMTHGLSLRELRQEEYSLESVFGELTQRPA